MWTNNYLNYAKTVMLGRAYTIGTLPIKAINGSIFYAAGANQGAYPVADNSSSVNQANGINIGWNFGTDDTPESVDDYTINGFIQKTGNFNSTVSVSSLIDAENSKAIKRITITLTNISANTLTIKEMGLVDDIYASASYNSSSNIVVRSALFYRHVFKTPIVLAQNDITSIIVDFSADI